MTMFTRLALVVSVLVATISSGAAPHRSTDEDFFKITVRMLENGEKRSSHTVSVRDRTSASLLQVKNNRQYLRRFIMLEKKGEKALVRLHQCEGELSDVLRANLSAVDCLPALASRLSVETELGHTAALETIENDGIKREYFVTVQRSGNNSL